MTSQDTATTLPHDDGDAPVSLTKFDGHKEGNLNCVALRHGWTRTFALPPEMVEHLDYATLEAVLELPTLKLRALSLRVFVENPPQSGNYSKIRFWRDDGSLQSVLVQQFFIQRREQGIVTMFEIRDGHEREDAMSVRSGVSSLMPRKGQTKEWMKAQRDRLGRIASRKSEESSAPPAAPKPSRFQALKYALGFRSAPPPVAPSAAAATDEEHTEDEETVMRQRGWSPPGVLGIMTPSSLLRINSLKNAFSSHAKSPPPVHEADIQEEGDGELLLAPEELTQTDIDNIAQNKAKGNKWRLFGTTDHSSTSLNDAQNPFLGAEERGKKRNKGKKKDKQFRGATVVRKPEEAFEHGPTNEQD
ncbi:hypothetical protein FISHEDRAFT_68845 [Fistulina hepatica ATCC 64428]|uniref:Uncharacterized protein n=1 Tax=Fistulina hepatica ATCC 64428 TaxID=1128425 RepID=A0A0D7AP05_9AGAR|nr:hypothetical protein FISHEDRAFT_68845 [Fistulina hepatica ATCC 64428]